MNTLNEEPLDHHILAELREATEEMFPEIIEAFLEDTPPRIQRLRAAVEACDFAAMTEESHSIKGSSSNIGAQKLSLICAEMEKQSRSNRMTDQDALIDLISEEYSLVEEELRQVLIE